MSRNTVAGKNQNRKWDIGISDHMDKWSKIFTIFPKDVDCPFCHLVYVNRFLVAIWPLHLLVGLSYTTIEYPHYDTDGTSRQSLPIYLSIVREQPHTTIDSRELGIPSALPYINLRSVD